MAYVSFEPLKAWIAQQEDYERRFGRPAPLTDNERLAMAVLVPPPPTPPPAPPVRPDVDLASVDCVSLLTRYAAAQKGAYAPPVYVDERVEGKPVLWRCRCTLPHEAPGRAFPDLLDEDPRFSAFSAKKAAKQHAARRAVEWLMAHGHMPTDGVSVVFPACPKRAAAPPARNRDATAVQKGPALGGSRSLSSSVSSMSRGTPSPLPAAAAAAAAAKPPTPEVVPRNNAAAQETLPLPQRPPSSMQDVVVVAQPATTTTAPPPTGNIESMASWRSVAPPPAAVAVTPPAEPDAAAAAVAAVAVAAVGEKRPVVEPPATSTAHSKRIRGSPRSSRHGSGSSGGGDSDQESMSNMEQLARLCEMFHLGAPRYELQSGQGDNVYSGSVTLTAAASAASSAKNAKTNGDAAGDGGRVIPLPPGVGVVRDIYLKRPAKEKMAQSVLQFLRRNVLQLSAETE